MKKIIDALSEMPGWSATQDESAEATEPSTAESSKDAFSESESTVTVSETKEEN